MEPGDEARYQYDTVYLHTRMQLLIAVGIVAYFFFLKYTVQASVNHHAGHLAQLAGQYNDIVFKQDMAKKEIYSLL